VSCGQTVLDSNIPFGAKDAPFIWTSGKKKTIRKFNPPPILRVKWGVGMENVGKNALKFDYFDRYERY
jgi:hypothetical protein